MANISVTTLIRRKTEVDNCARLTQNLITACAHDTEVAQQVERLLSTGNNGGDLSGKPADEVLSIVNGHLYNYSSVLGNYIDSAEVDFPD